MLNPLLIAGNIEGSQRRSRWHRRRLVRSVYTSRCTGARRTLYTLFCLREIPADSYSLERNKRYLFPSSLFFSVSLSLSFGLAEENRPRGSGEVPATWPTTPLRSLRSRTSYQGFSFYASHFLLSANFVFLSCPSLTLHPRSPSRFFRSFFLSFPLFLLLHPGTRSRGIMQHITEKSKQARRNSPGLDSRVGLLSLKRRFSRSCTVPAPIVQPKNIDSSR